MEKSTNKLKSERDMAVQERDKLKVKYNATASELAGYKKKEEEGRYFSRKKMNDVAQRITREEQLTRSLQKALTIIDAYGLRDEYNHAKLNTVQRKTVLE